MSYDYRYTQKRSTNNGNRPGRRSFYAPPPPPQHGSSHHGLFTYWLPLVVTGTIAIGGLAAWIWSERDHDEDERPHDKPPRPQTGPGQPYPTQGSQPYSGPAQPPPSQQQGPPPPAPAGGEASSYYDQSQTYRAEQTATTSESRDIEQRQDESTWYGRMTGMMKRTPSPQQFFDSATKQVSTGVAALGSIFEDNGEEEFDERRDYSSDGRGKKRRGNEPRSSEAARREEGFSDHERWSEEADEQESRIGLVEAESERRAESARAVRDDGKKKRTIAVVVSADMDTQIGRQDEEHEDAGYNIEHASILSHLPQNTSATSDLFILIFSPGLKTIPPLTYQPGNETSSTSTPAVHTPGSELQSISPRPSSPTVPFTSPSPHFSAIYAQSLALVSSATQILPFTTPDGYVHILRHLAPSLVYVSDLLSGEEGEAVAALKGWVGHTMVVAGDEGAGGLVDTETETEAEDEGRRKKTAGKGKWYERSGFVGLGKEVEVVDVGRVGEDWGRRIGGRA